MNLFLLVNNINCNCYHDEYVNGQDKWNNFDFHQ